MSYLITDQIPGTQPIAEFASARSDNSLPIHPLGTIVRAVDPDYGEGEFIYLKGVASTIVGSWVTYNLDDGTSTLLAANAVGPVAISMSANIAATTYGWYQISGKAVGVTLTLFSITANVWAAGGGAVDNASVAGDGINIAKGTSDAVIDTLVADFEIHRPFVNNQTSFS